MYTFPRLKSSSEDGVWRLFGLVWFLTACTAYVAADAGEASHCVAVSPPAQWQAAKRIHLVLEGVTAPGDQPLKIRVTAGVGDDPQTVLGAVGVEAISRFAKEERRLPALRVDVTRSLKQLLERKPDAKPLTVCAHAVDGRNAPLRDIVWSVKSVRFETSSE